MTRCPDVARLRQFLDGQLSEAESREIDRHVNTCWQCRKEQERLTAPDGNALPLPPIPPGDSPPPDPTPAANGELPVVPGYQLVEELGHGGRGIVYLADSDRLPRPVALKLMRADICVGPRDLERFRVEMEAHARLRNPNIILIHEIGGHEKQPFFTMEYVRGGTLRDRLRCGLPLPRDAARLVETLARAIHYAHQRGVLHRDLKPANVLLQDGPDDEPSASAARTPAHSGRVTATPKITDFGLALFLDAREDEARLTQPNEAPGTPSYMAPEQAAGKLSDVGTQTDVYGLGAVLYEALTGHAPFEGASRQEILRKVQSDEELPAPPRRLRPEVPADLELICLKCLEKEPARRYASAEQLAGELGRFLRGEPLAHTGRVGPGERLWRWCRRNRALAGATALAAAALVAVTVVSVLWAVRERANAQALGEAADRERDIAQARGEALDQAQYRLAENHFDHGQSLCERGDIGPGLLWLARSLETAPASADGLRSTIRTQLAGWGRHVLPLRACLDSPAPVTAAALSPDGRTVWAAGRDRCLRRWDVAGQELLGLPAALPAPVTAIAWGPRGKVLTVYNDGTAQLWDAVKGTPAGPPLPHRVNSAAWDRDGRYLVTGGDDGHVRFWNEDGSDSDRAGFKAAAKARVLAVSPDGTRVVTGEGDSTLLWDAAAGRVLGETMRHPGDVLAAAFDPDGRTVLTSSEGQTSRRWDAATGKPAGDPVRHKGSVQALAFSPGGGVFVTGGRDRTARVWGAANQAVGQPLPHEAAVHTVRFSADGRTLLTAGFERTLRVWEIVVRGPSGLVLAHGGHVQSTGFLPRDGTAFTAGPDGVVRLWRADTGEAIGQRVTNPREPIMTVTPSRDGSRLLARCFTPGAWLWDTAAQGRAGIRLSGPALVNSAALSPDGSVVLTGSHDGGVRFWKPPYDAPWTEVRAHNGPVHGAAFSPDGRTAATSGEDGTVWLWDVASGTRLRQLAHGGPLWWLAFSPGGETLLTAGTGPVARLWAVSSGEPLEPDLRHGGAVRAAVFSPDGRTILTASDDGTARLWDAATRTPRGGPLVHNDVVAAAAFSPDGKTALTGSWDGTARLWDVTTGKSLGLPLAHAKAVHAVAFSPDGKTALTGSADRTARLWEVPPPAEESPQLIALELEVLTGLSLDAIGTLRVLDAAAWAERRRRLENP
jgi:WD40 repeat protein